jgi:4-oxalocrotonate tautomerase
MEKTLGGRSLGHNPLTLPLSPRGRGWGEGHRKEISMPIVQISLLPGRTPEKKEELIKNVTNAIADTLQIPKDRVHIVLHEVPKENIGRGGVPLSKMDL